MMQVTQPVSVTMLQRLLGSSPARLLEQELCQAAGSCL